MIALDTNILVYAHREDSAWHEPALRCVNVLATGASPWCIPWPCLHEFIGVVTHPRIYRPPTPVAQALDQVEAWLEAPRVVLLAECEGYWETLKAAVSTGQVAGPRVHDARVVALCHHHGVAELWSADRDFSRFRSLRVRNPLIETR